MIKYKRTLHMHVSDYLKNTQCRNNCTAAVRKIKHDFESNLVNGIKVNPKRFWRYVASQTKVKQAVGRSLKSDGSPTVDDRNTRPVYGDFKRGFCLVGTLRKLWYFSIQNMKVSANNGTHNHTTTPKQSGHNTTYI